MSTLDLETTRTIADIRKDGLDKAVLERIAADRAEMQSQGRTEGEIAWAVRILKTR